MSEKEAMLELVFDQFKAEVDDWKRQIEIQQEDVFASTRLMSLDPGENFGKTKSLLRRTRQACPGRPNTFAAGFIFAIYIADSAQTEYCPTFHCLCVRPSQA